MQMPIWATPVKDLTGGVNFRLGRFASICANYPFSNDVSQIGETVRLPARLLADEPRDRGRREALRGRVRVGVGRRHPQRLVVGSPER